MQGVPHQHEAHNQPQQQFYGGGAMTKRSHGGGGGYHDSGPGLRRPFDSGPQHYQHPQHNYDMGGGRGRGRWMDREPPTKAVTRIPPRFQKQR